VSGDDSMPNIVYFHVDNLGYGELGRNGGGVLRGADTKRIDRFAREGFQLLNYAPMPNARRTDAVDDRSPVRSMVRTTTQRGVNVLPSAPGSEAEGKLQAEA
jgi:hypothetical protein